MASFAELRNLVRFATGYPSFLRERLSLEQARATLRERLRQRPENLLRWVKRAVFERPGGVYRALFDHAGCEYGDLERSVRADGPEAALAALRQAGVWVAYEEFKGRRAVVRGGREIPTGPGAFDNPFVGPSLQRTTGGSSGRATRVMVDLDYFRDRAPNLAVADHAQGLDGVPWAMWFGGLPDCGPNVVLSQLPYDSLPERWFDPIGDGAVRGAWRLDLGNRLVVHGARAFGRPVPVPEPVPLAEALTVARWAESTVARAGRAVLRCYVSLAMRVSSAALEHGIDLRGVVICGGGEPPTEGKVREIERCGARFQPNYYFAEAGPVAAGCLAPMGPNDLHLFEDRLAVVQCPREAGGVTVDAFLFTGLLPSAPKLLFNVESDDYGVLETRACGCGLEREGFARHVRDVRSFGKLTSHGMTVVAGELSRVLEEVLPARFAASAVDFQLVEVEEPGAATRLRFVVSPRVAASDAALSEALFAALSQGTAAADFARAIWSQAGTVQVVRAEPEVTAMGKTRPLHLKARGPLEVS